MNNRRRRYTWVDLLRASKTSPIHWRKIKMTMESLRATVDVLFDKQQQPMRFHWAELVDVTNVIEAMLGLNYIADPDSLFDDVHKALAGFGTLVIKYPGKRPEFTPEQKEAVIDLVDGYESMLRQLSEYQVLRSYVLTEERLQGILSGGAVGAGAVVLEC